MTADVFQTSYLILKLNTDFPNLSINDVRKKNKMRIQIHIREISSQEIQDSNKQITGALEQLNYKIRL